MTTFALTVLLAIVVAAITASATALRFVSRIWLRHWMERQPESAGDDRAAAAGDRSEQWLFAAGTGIAASVFAIGAVIGVRESPAFVIEQILGAAIVLMIFGQLLPRAVARRWAEQVIPIMTPFLRMLTWICTPLFAIAARFAPATHPAVLPVAGESRDSLEDVLREGEAEGVGDSSESAIISGVVEFGEKFVVDVMTPRAEIIAVERAMPAFDIARVVAQSKYSRVPVYDGDIDHMIGLVNSFDILAHPDAPVESIRRVAHVPAATPCHEVMRAMLREHVHLAIIHDASGATMGLVTLEDLVEELVGDISDEHDEPRPVTA